MTGDLTRVRVRLGGRLVAEHARVYARGQVLSDPAHVETARVLRKAFQARPRRVDDEGLTPFDESLTRDLADYDRAFGLVGEL